MPQKLKKLPNYSLLIPILFVSIQIASCNNESVTPIADSTSEYHEFESYDDFKTTLQNIVNTTDATNGSKTDAFWDSLVSNRQVPFIMNDTVAFLYKGKESTVSWAGDFNGWNPSWKGEALGDSDILLYETTFPADARLDYKIVIGNNWILDPNNVNIQYSGFGPNSELRMPSWEFPSETLRNSDTPKGSLTENTIIESANLGYKVQYKVYTPYNYDTQNDLPVLYITDGHEYADDRLGALIIVLDNLIYEGVMAPIIAVFIDPRNPDNLSENRRMEEYRANLNYANFVADELVKTIDTDYKTSVNPDQRAILGTSLGGWNSAYVGLHRSDMFHLIGIHSPAFDNNIVQDYSTNSVLPLKIFMSTGVIHDTETKARAMKEVFDDIGYPLLYQEVNQGHSWGNWRGMLKQPLIYFFGN